MMYSNNCVLAVIVNGTPSTELANGSVQIPFGSEYVIRVRNKDKKRRVVAKVFVDGENVAEGGIVVAPGSYVDLEAPVGLHKRFKFVSLDSPEAVDFGKNGPNVDKTKGLIEARFHFEKQPPVVEHHHHHHHNWQNIPYSYPRPWRDYPWTYPIGTRVETFGNITRKIQMSAGGCSMDDSTGGCSMDELGFDSQINNQALEWNNASMSECSVSSREVSDGCTVEGSYTGQTFGSAYVDYETEATVLKIFLQGFDLGVVTPTRKKSNVAKIKEVTDLIEAHDEDEELKQLRNNRLDLEKELERRRIAKLEQELNEMN